MTDNSGQVGNEQSSSSALAECEDTSTINIISELKKMRIEPKVSFSEQMVFKGVQYRALQIFVTIIFALLIIGAMLVNLLGAKHWAIVPLVTSLAAGGLITFGAFAIFMLISSLIQQRREGDPFSAANLKNRFEHERNCTKQITDLKPSRDILERVALHLKGQIERYAGYTSARNQYFVSVKDLTLAFLLIIGVTTGNATGGWAEFIRTAQWAGALALILGAGLGQISKAKVYRYQFWLSVIDLARHSTKPDAGNEKNGTSA